MEGAAARIVADATRSLWAHDALGRRLEIRPITALDRLRMFKALGPALAQNASYLGMSLLAASVIAVDGVPVPAPGNETQVEALVGRLGEDGISAAAEALQARPEVAETIDTGN